MSITVGFTTSSKRENSTKRLYMTESHYCTFKNGCSLLNPTLLLELETSTFPAYTAFKIENRYYNVRDIRSVRNNLFEIDGKIDVLATFKANILATTAYVIYDSTSNSELPDNRLPIITTPVIRTAHSENPPFDDYDGVYILSITGSHNSTGIYRISETQLNQLVDDLQHVLDNIFNYPAFPDKSQFPNKPVEPGTPPGSSINIWEWFKWWGETFAWNFDFFLQEVIPWILECIQTPIAQFFVTGSITENIRECKYIPFNIGTSGGTIPIYLGTFKTHDDSTSSGALEFGRLNTDHVIKASSVNIPWPLIDGDPITDYRRRSPYTEVYLYLPYIGITKLSSENLAAYDSLNIEYSISMRTGDIVCTVTSGTLNHTETLGQYAGNCACEVPVGFSNISLPKAAQSLFAAANNAAHNNPFGTGMAMISFGENVTPYYTSIGGLDGIAALGSPQDIICFTVFHNTNVPPNSQLQTIGSPTMAPKSLSGLSGYVQTMSASVSGSMTSEERSLINTLLDNGIYIEADEEPPT